MKLITFDKVWKQNLFELLGDLPYTVMNNQQFVLTIKTVQLEDYKWTRNSNVYTHLMSDSQVKTIRHPRNVCKENEKRITIKYRKITMNDLQQERQPKLGTLTWTGQNQTATEISLSG